MQKTQVQSLGQEDPLEKGWLSTPVFLPGEFHGQRSLVGDSQWCHKELDMTEWLARGKLGSHMAPEKNWLYLLSQFFSCRLCGTLPSWALLGPIEVPSGNHTAESKHLCWAPRAFDMLAQSFLAAPSPGRPLLCSPGSLPPPSLSSQTPLPDSSWLSQPLTLGMSQDSVPWSLFQSFYEHGLAFLTLS